MVTIPFIIDGPPGSDADKVNQNFSAVGGAIPGSDIVRLASGVISSPVAFFDLPLPSGFTSFEFDFSNVRFSIGSANSVIAADFSINNGASFMCDPVNADTYVQGGPSSVSTLGIPSSSNVVSYGDGLLSFAGGQKINTAGSMTLKIYQSSDLDWFMVIGTSAVVDKFGSPANTMELDNFYLTMFLGATVPPPSNPQPITTMRVLPYGNADSNPPTSGINIISGAYTLWGISSSTTGQSPSPPSPPGEYVFLDTRSAPVSYTLPDPAVTAELTIKDKYGNCHANNITVYGSGVSLVDGQPTFVMNQDFGSYTFVWNGDSWSVT